MQSKIDALSVFLSRFRAAEEEYISALKTLSSRNGMADFQNARDRFREAQEELDQFVDANLIGSPDS